MSDFKRNLSVGIAAVTVLALTVAPGLAQDAAAPAAAAAVEKTAATAPNVDYIFNTLLFLMTGFLVMWMAAGFAMLEAGLVRSKNVAMQCTKNIALYSIGGIMFWLIGYNLMYPGDDGWIVADTIGKFMPVTMPAPGEDTGGAYATGSDWFFQMVFCATTASIVSGTLAERIKLWPFLIFIVVLTGFIYPIQGSWEWGTGWLDDMGFSDFAGSTLVHSCGGWAALAGALLLGARAGKYGPNGAINPMPGSSMPLATLGTFILWLGWFGFNGGSQLALGSLENASAVARIFVNTNMAAASGVLVAMVLTQVIYGKVDLTMALNGALAGLVSITAEPLAPAIWQSVVIGGVGGVIVVFTVPLLDKLRIDDVVGAIPVHLFAGIWGTLIVAWTNADANIVVQATGVAAIGAFVFVSSFVMWAFLKFTIGLRPSLEDETNGLDMSEIGIEAYPEFGTGSQRI
ncbi:MAG: ammonium transporter [Alphaproteobacteria bacterium]|nr:ammonium transporter [Alphaproteobacteria bacterium]